MLVLVLCCPQVFAITNYLAMFFPRGAAMFELLQHIYEAQALYCFGALLLDLASGAPWTAAMMARLSPCACGHIYVHATGFGTHQRLVVVTLFL